MTDSVRHRGPDDEGFWLSDTGTVALGQRRLSVIDVTVGGHQPMLLGGGRYTIVYNGELYNYLELRERLRATGVEFTSASDTEVVLKACIHWGVERALVEFNGMFAFAFWDGADGRIWLARDRFGEKPLYWSLHDGSLSFASELRALSLLPGFDRTIDRSTLAKFAKHGVCPAPGSMYVGARKLMPGTALGFSVDTRRHTVESPVVHVYFDAAETAIRARSTPFCGSYDDAVNATEEALTKSVQSRMISDVPLGAFLSGGIDSSLVVALMASIHSSPIRTFTIGFEDQEMNEAPHALEIAKILGTHHVEAILSTADLLAIVPTLGTMYDEPFADSSQIPTYLVSELARRDVTVSLSGDGGDELFGGYNRYFLAARQWQRIARIPVGARRVGGRAIEAVPPRFWDGIGSFSSMMRGADSVGGSLAERVGKIGRTVDAPTGMDLYDRLVSQWSISPVLGANLSTVRAFAESERSSGPLSLAEQMMLADTTGYLPDDILTKVDRASMAVSLEARVPILDPDVFELAWRLPMEYKVHGGQGKRVLRSILKRNLPGGVIKGPKKGFGVPLAGWLRGNLRDWADDLLDPTSLADDGYFDVGLVRATWDDHQSGRADLHSQLWCVLMFQSWLRHQATAVGCSRTEDA